MRKWKLTALIVSIALVCALGLAACKHNPPPEDDPPALYTVTFVANGGSAVPEQGVYEGEKIAKPGDPARGGYEFVAWYKEEALTTEWNFDTDTVTGDTTLYAKWRLGTAAQDANFDYALTGQTYTIAKKPGVTLPADLVLPAEYEGKAVTAIADGAFENEAGLRSVVIPDSITEIGRQAFRNCAALAAVNEAENIEQIGSNAFYGTAWALALTGSDVYLGKTYYTYAGGMYTDTEITVRDGTVGIAAGAFDSKEKLTAVTLPASLKYIGDYAFGGARKGTGLTTVTLPAGLLRIGNNAFRNAGLTSVTIGEAVTYIGDSAFAGCPVAELNYSAANAAFGSIAAFNNNETVAAVTIGDNVADFPAALFQNWPGVVEVDLGDGITALPANAFDGRSGITTVTLGAGLTEIGNYALRGTGVTEAILPENLTSLGNGAYANCANLTKITLNAKNLVKGGAAGAPAFANCPKVTEIVVGERAENVPAELFRGLAAVTKLTLGGAKTIGDRAFYGIAVTNLTVPASVTSLGQDAFGGNAALTAVAFNAAEAVTVTGSTSIFGGCTALAAVTVGAGVQNIPAYFLIGNTNVSAVTLPESVTSVGDHAFDGCTKLAQISGVERVTSIGQDAFNNTPWFTEYMKTPGLVYLGSVLYAYNGDMPAGYALTIRAGTTAISPDAFKNKTNLTSVTFPAGLTEIGASAFLNCTGLTAIALPDSVAKLGARAFDGCSNLQSATLGGITEIPEAAFNGCSKLSGIAFGDRITAIGANAFMGCTALTEVSVPASVKTIGFGAFYNTGLTALTLSEGIESIGNIAFGQTKLATVTVPASVKTVGKEVFSSCNDLTSATVNGAAVGERMFLNCAKLASVTLGDNVKSIGAEAFFGTANATMLKALTRIDLNKVETIGAKAFCSTGLTALTLPNTLKEIGDNAFDSCTSLNIRLTLPASVTAWGTGCFKGSGLIAVEIPASMKTIPATMFRECRQLESVTIADGVNAISAAAFMICPKLTTVALPASVHEIAAAALNGVRVVYLNAAKDAVIAPTAFSSNAIFLTDEFAIYRAADSWKSFADRIYATEMLVDGVFMVDNSVLSIYLGAGGIVTIPAGVASLKTGVFDGVSVTSFALASGNTAFSVVDGNLLSADGTEFILYASANTAESFTIPETVTSIATGAFRSNTALTAVTLLSTTPPVLGADAFSSKVNTFNVPRDCGAAYRTAAGWSAFASMIVTEGEEVVEFVVADGVLTRYNGSGGEVVLPDEVTEIAADAFGANATITKLTIGPNVTKIAPTALNGLTGLKHVVYNAVAAADMTRANSFMSTVETLEIGAGVKVIPAYMFFNANLIESIALPGAVEKVGAYAFGISSLLSSSSALRSITLNEGIQTIGQNFLEQQKGVKELTLPASLTAVDRFALTSTAIAKVTNLSACNGFFSVLKNSLEEVVFGANYALTTSEFYGFGLLKKVTLPSGLTEIPANAFSGCKLTSVELPATLTSIGNGAFENCKLTSLVLPAGLVIIDGNAFRSNPIEGTIVLPRTLTSIRANAFSGTRVTKVIINSVALRSNSWNFGALEPELAADATVLPGYFYSAFQGDELRVREGITEIGAQAFNGAQAGTLILPETVTTIVKFSFSAVGVKSIILPDSLTSIPQWAFNYSTVLESVTFGKDVTDIKQAFRNCTAVKELIFKGSTPAAIAENAFPANEGLTIKVPAGSVEAYKAAWTAYADAIVADTTPAPEPTPEPTPAPAALAVPVKRTAL